MSREKWLVTHARLERWSRRADLALFTGRTRRELRQAVVVNRARDAETVVITGASSGVGRATAHIFAQHGCSLGLLARGQESLDATAREVEQLGGQALAIPTDVAEANQIQKAAEKVQARFGSIDVWVNNAMTTIFAPFSEISAEEYKRATEVTYLGTVYGTMTALRAMRCLRR